MALGFILFTKASLTPKLLTVSCFLYLFLLFQFLLIHVHPSGIYFAVKLEISGRVPVLLVCMHAKYNLISSTSQLISHVYLY